MAEIVQRPTRGEDLLMLQRKLGYSNHDMQWMLGLNTLAYQKAVSVKGGRSPLNMPVALVIRLLRENAEFSPIPSEPRPKEFFELCRAVDPDFSAAKFATLFGRGETSAYRWLKNEKVSMTKSVRRWMLVMWRALVTAPTKAERKSRLDGFFETVVDEAGARGYDRALLAHANKWQLTNQPNEHKAPNAVGLGEKVERMVSVPAGKRVRAARVRSPTAKPKMKAGPTKAKPKR